MKYICPNTGGQMQTKKVGGRVLFDGWRFPTTIRIGGTRVCAHCGDRVDGVGLTTPHWVSVRDEQTVLAEFSE